MKLTKKIFLTCLTVSTLMMSVLPAHAQVGPLSTTTIAVPTEVINANTYVEIPVTYKEAVTPIVSAYLEKSGNHGNSNAFHISGYANFIIKAYAYKTGSNIKVGASISYINTAGNLVTDWWDNIEQFYSVEEAESLIAWPNCSNYALNVEDTIRFEMPDQNENDLRVNLMLSGVKSSFSRPTNQGVALDKTPSIENVPNVPGEDTLGEMIPDVPETDVPSDTTPDVPEVDEPSHSTPDMSEGNTSTPPKFDNASGLDPENY